MVPACGDAGDVAAAGVGWLVGPEEDFARDGDVLRVADAQLAGAVGAQGVEDWGECW